MAMYTTTGNHGRSIKCWSQWEMLRKSVLMSSIVWQTSILTKVLKSLFYSLLCSLWSLAGKDQVEQYFLLSLWHLFGFCSTNVKSFSQLISFFVKSVLSRPIWEGGQYEGDETKRREALRLAMQLRASYIDVELEVSILSNKLRFLVQKFSIGKYHLILLFGGPEPPSLYCFADCSWIQRVHGWKETW